jgi:cullin-4
MKAQKTMNFQKLTIKAIDAVKGHFKPEVDEIKRRIDALVETEYLERVEGERGMFRYLA